MAFDVNSFKANISKYGILQNNRFQVSIPLNTNLKSATNMSLSDASRLLTFRAGKAVLPQIEFASVDNAIFGIGPVQKMPTNIIFPDVQLSFLSDGTGEIQNFLYGWFNYIYNFVGINNSVPTYSLNYKDNYCTDISIITYDNQGNAVTTHTLHRAYPSGIGAIPLDWGSNNKLMTIEVSLTYFTCSLKRHITITN